MCSTLTFIFANKTSKTIPQILTVSRVFHIGSTPQGRYRLAAGKKTLQTLFLQNQSLVSPVVNQQIANPYFIYFFSPCFPTIILVTIFNQWRCKISFYSIVFLQHQCWSSLVANQDITNPPLLPILYLGILDTNPIWQQPLATFWFFAQSQDSSWPFLQNSWRGNS